MIGAIVARRHRITANLGIPRDGQLQQPALRRAVYVRDGVVSGADGERDGFLDYVDRLPLRVDLMPGNGSGRNPVVAIGEPMVERARSRRGPLRDRAAHARLPVSLDHRRVAGEAIISWRRRGERLRTE